MVCLQQFGEVNNYDDNVKIKSFPALDTVIGLLLVKELKLEAPLLLLILIGCTSKCSYAHLAFFIYTTMLLGNDSLSVEALFAKP